MVLCESNLITFSDENEILSLAYLMIFYIVPTTLL